MHMVAVRPWPTKFLNKHLELPTIPPQIPGGIHSGFVVGRGVNKRHDRRYPSRTHTAKRSMLEASTREPRKSRVMFSVCPRARYTRNPSLDIYLLSVDSRLARPHCRLRTWRGREIEWVV